MIGWGNTSPLNWLICKAPPRSFLLVFQSNPSRRLLHVKVNRITYSACYHGIDHDLLSKTMVRDGETGETDPRILYELHFGWNFEELLLGNDKPRLRKWWINGDSNPAGNKEHQRNMQQKYFTLLDCLRTLNHDVVFQLQCLSESEKHQISQEEWWLWLVLLLLACKVRHSLSHHRGYRSWFNNRSLTCIDSTAGLCSKQLLSTQHVQPEHCVPWTYEICNVCNLPCNSFKFHCSCPGSWRMHQKIKVNAAGLDDSSPPQISRAASGPSTETLGIIGKLTTENQPYGEISKLPGAHGLKGRQFWDMSKCTQLICPSLWNIRVSICMFLYSTGTLLHLEDSVHKYDLVHKHDPTRRSFLDIVGGL